MVGRRPASWLKYRGRFYVPAGGLSKYIVGSETWLENEQSLSVRRNEDFPESVMVWVDDPQIMFPPPERWVWADRYKRLMHKPEAASDGHRATGGP